MDYDHEHHRAEQRYEKLSPTAKLFGVLAVGLMVWVAWGMLTGIYANLVYVWGN